MTTGHPSGKSHKLSDMQVKVGGGERRAELSVNGTPNGDNKSGSFSVLSRKGQMAEK